VPNGWSNPLPKLYGGQILENKDLVIRQYFGPLPESIAAWCILKTRSELSLPMMIPDLSTKCPEARQGIKASPKKI
jgi:hypothetical protein